MKGNESESSEKINDIKEALKHLPTESKEALRVLDSGNRRFVIDRIVVDPISFVPTPENIRAESARFDGIKGEFISQLDSQNFSLMLEIRNDVLSKGIDLLKDEGVRNRILGIYEIGLTEGKSQLVEEVRSAFGDIIDLSEVDKGIEVPLPVVDITASSTVEPNPLDITQEIDESELIEEDAESEFGSEANSATPPPVPSGTDVDSDDEDDQLDVDTVVGEGEEECEVQPRIGVGEMEFADLDLEGPPLPPEMRDESFNADSDDSLENEEAIHPLNTGDLEEMPEASFEPVDISEANIEPADAPDEDELDGIQLESDGDFEEYSFAEDDNGNNDEIDSSQLEKAKGRIEELNALVEAKDRENNGISMEITDIRQQLETAKAQLEEKQALLDEESGVTAEVKVQLVTLRGSFEAEQERRKELEGLVSLMRSKLQAESDERQRLDKELADTKSTSAAELSALQEKLRLATQDAETHRAEAMSENIENAALRRKLEEEETLAGQLTAKQVELDHALHRIAELQTDLAHEKSETERLVKQLTETRQVAISAENLTNREIEGIRIRNDELSRMVIDLKQKNATLNAKVTELSSSKAELDQAQERISVLEGQIDDFRFMNGRLRNRLINLSEFEDNPLPESLSKDPEVIEPTEKTEAEIMNEGFLNRLRRGAMINAKMYFDEHFGLLHYEDIDGFKEAVQQGYDLILQNGDEEKAREFKKLFS